MTINDVRYAVHAALDSAFPGIPVSDEEIKQQMLDHPCFYVRLLESTHTQEMDRRYRRNYPFVVSYVNPERDIDDSFNKAEQLTAALQRISVGDRQRLGQEMKFQVEHNVLHFFTTYSLLVWEQIPDDPKMQTLNQEGFIDG